MNTQEDKEQKIIVNIYEESYPFSNSKEKNLEFKDLPASKIWAKNQIIEQRSYRPNTKKMWATFTVNGRELFNERIKESELTQFVTNKNDLKQGYWEEQFEKGVNPKEPTKFWKIERTNDLNNSPLNITAQEVFEHLRTKHENTLPLYDEYLAIYIANSQPNLIEPDYFKKEQLEIINSFTPLEKEIISNVIIISNLEGQIDINPTNSLKAQSEMESIINTLDSTIITQNDLSFSHEEFKTSNHEKEGMSPKEFDNLLSTSFNPKINGSIVQEKGPRNTNLRGRYLNDKKHGVWQTFTEQNELLSENEYKLGVKDGKQTIYNPDGNVKTSVIFTNGKLNELPQEEQFLTNVTAHINNRDFNALKQYENPTVKQRKAIIHTETITLNDKVVALTIMKVGNVADLLKESTRIKDHKESNRITIKQNKGKGKEM
jgi:hypothetical protein